MIHVFFLYQPEALLAVPEPPEPPPMTIQSYCLGAGAMMGLEVEKCLEIEFSRTEVLEA